MTKRLEVYKCNACGNIVEVIHASSGELVCCNQPMNLLVEKSRDTGNEKHLPVIKKENNQVIVNIGSIEHPMEENHFIQWIELITKDNVYRKYLSPGQKPAAVFNTDEEIISVREYCNVHGLWSTK